MDIDGPLPMLVIFGMDHTLWPFYLETDYCFPFSRDSIGRVVDCRGIPVKYFNDVPKIFQWLKNRSVLIVITSITTMVTSAKELLEKLGWMHYIAFTEMHRPYKDKFEIIRIRSGFQYSEMLVFDDWEENIRTAAKFGVHGKVVRKGMTIKDFEEGIREFQEKNSK